MVLRGSTYIDGDPTLVRFPVKEMDLFGYDGKPQRCDLSLKLGISVSRIEEGSVCGT
ncbi:hypothetical protein F2Q69_00046981 [Brassica cretica]|uniref:Uncharacterized protein n=1 Tax=Brassica cretica TaxID=69181 RepID=A0A8S9Q083_BRACR|nr:hypothetical protein F2Q69_00046981 [Brassica cretica]